MTMPELMEIADGIPYKSDVSQGTKWALGQLFPGSGKFKRYQTIKGTDFAVHHLRWHTYMRRYLAKHEPDLYADRIETPEFFIVRINRLRCLAVFLDKDKCPHPVPSRTQEP